jgi:hypothetical protein
MPYRLPVDTLIADSSVFLDLLRLWTNGAMETGVKTSEIGEDTQMFSWRFDWIFHQFLQAIFEFLIILDFFIRHNLTVSPST